MLMWIFGDDFVLQEIRRLVKEGVRYLKEIRSFFPVIPTGVKVIQIGDDSMPGAGSNNITQGGTGRFQAQPTPAGSAFPTGTTFAASSDDSQITLTQNLTVDPSGATFDAQDAAGDPATTANIVIAAQMPGTPPPAVLTGTDPITITPVGPPLPTGLNVVQVG
jgi:hypothetical protein